ncbi:MAG: ribonuclease P protein component [Candidatus Saccharimonas sp.]
MYNDNEIENMIAQQYRFHGHGSLAYVYRNAAVYRSRLFTVKSIPNLRRKKSRFAVVVSKKTHKSAFGRNRIRRRIYELIRAEIPHIQQTTDAVIIVTNAEVMSLDHAELRTMLRNTMRQAQIIA